MSAPSREQVIGEAIIGIAHSKYSEPEFIAQGIGPASFRSHYLILSNDLVLDLFRAELTLASLPDEAMAGDTEDLAVGELLGRRITAVVWDDTGGALVIVDGNIFLQDAVGGFYGNPLLAGHLEEHYSEAERASFTDYWTGEPT